MTANGIFWTVTLVGWILLAGRGLYLHGAERPCRLMAAVDGDGGSPLIWVIMGAMWPALLAMAIVASPFALVYQAGKHSRLRAEESARLLREAEAELARIEQHEKERP